MIQILLIVVGFAQAELLSGTRYLRSVALDVLGRVPTMEEYELIEDGGEIPADLLDQWLQSPEFADRVVRHHNSLLWNRIATNVLIQDRDFQIQKSDGNYWIRRRSEFYRGGDPRAEKCGSQEAVMVDGRPVPVDDNGILREGWRWVSPFWDPENPIKVCAFEAQEDRYSTTGTDCRAKGAETDPECGCGPNLQWCFSSTDNSMTRIQEAFGVQIDQHIRAMVLQDRSYLEILQGDTVMVNGPIAHYYRHQVFSPNLLRTENPPLDPELLPELLYTDTDVWHEIPSVEGASGILTLPGFLLRFMTNRSRADRFNTAFLCSEFIGPSGGLPPDDDGALMPDLTQRNGCNYCHARLEPMAAFWGRWAESGSAWLDPDQYPAYNDFCQTCAEEDITCNETCDRFYITDAVSDMEREWIGWLHSYQFLQERYHNHVELGPDELVQEGVADGSLSACVVENTVTGLLNRDFGEREEDWKRSLATHFTASDFSYSELVRSVVTSDQYRRLR